MARPEDRFKQTITFAAVTGRDAYGRPAIGAKSTASARVQPMRRTIRDAVGEQVMSTHCIYTTAALSPAHRVWIPGSDVTVLAVSRRVLAVDDYADGEGTTRFRKVWL